MAEILDLMEVDVTCRDVPSNVSWTHALKAYVAVFEHIALNAKRGVSFARIAVENARLGAPMPGTEYEATYREELRQMLDGLDGTRRTIATLAKSGVRKPTVAQAA